MSTSILCPLCMVGGEATTYKGDDVVQCPDCEKILLREFDP